MAAPKPVRALRSDRLKVFTGNSNPTLATEICACLGVELGSAPIRSFADGEVYLQIKENVRGADCFIIQPTSFPANDNLMELLLLMDALRRASSAILPPRAPTAPSSDRP